MATEMAPEPRIHLQKMTDREIDAIAALERVCFSTPWSRRSFALAVADPAACNYVLFWDQRLAGYVVTFRRAEAFLIANLAVAPKFRRRGLARILLRKAMEEGELSGATFAVLDVRQSNREAIALYKSFGFKPVDRRKDYYALPREDALVMGRFLCPEHS